MDPAGVPPRLLGRIKLLDYWKAQGPPDDCTLDAEQVLCARETARR